MTDAPTPPDDDASRLKRLFSHTSVYAVGDLSIKITTAFLAPIYTVLLEPAEFGLWSLGVMIMTGLTYLYNPALHGAITRFYYDHEHDVAARRRFQGTLSVFLLGWSAALSGLLFVLGPWLFEHLFVDFPYAPYGELVTWMAFLGVLSVVPKAVWAASEQPRAFIGTSMLSSGVNVFGALIMIALLDMGVLGLFWARLLSLAIVGIPFGRFLWREVGVAWSPRDLKDALRFSLPLVPHLIAHWILAMSDRYVIEQMMGVAAVGIYGSAYAFTEFVNMVANSMNRAWVPMFTRAYADETQRPFIARSITYFVLAVGGASVTLAILAPTLVRDIYADRYADAAPIASVLALGGLFQGLYYIFVAGLFYFKRNGLIPVITVVAGLVNIALNILWIPSLGLLGAALATLLSYLVLTLGVWWGCRRVTRLPIEGRRLVILVGAMALALAGGLAVDGVWPWYGEWPAKLALIVATPLAMQLAGFWTAGELMAVRSRLKRLLGRG